MAWDEQIFTLVVLLVGAGVTSHIAHGFGTRKAKELFASLLLLIIVGGQMYHTIQAVTYIPATRFFTWDSGLHRNDCIDSYKGGKRYGNSTDYEDLNPCYCVNTALTTCYSTIDGSEYDLSSVACPTDGTAKCKQGEDKADRIHRYVPSLRDCRGGQKQYCTIDEPCTPCEADTLSTFKNGRCRTCSSQNSAECHFVPGEGPYCLISPDSKAVEPCSKCCTEPDPVYDADGYCY
jgi:hypothetical protein